MTYVRLDYEPVVVLATADAMEAEPEARVAVLVEPRLTYERDDGDVTCVDVDASIVLFASAHQAAPVRVVVQRAGTRERLSGVFVQRSTGRVRCELVNSQGLPAVLTAAGLRTSDWRESTAA